MKKLMFAIAAVAAGTVLADVSSANIVGYQGLAPTAYEEGGETLYYAYPNVGMTFKTVAEVPAGMPEGDYFKLGDTTVEGLDPMSGEFFYQIFTDSCSVDSDSAIVYVSKEMSIAAVGDDSMMGWWDQFITVPMNDALFPAGTAFIGSLGGSHDLTLQSAGEAKQGIININISGQAYPHMANPVPRDIKFKEIVVVGMDPMSGEFFYQADQRDCTVDSESAIVYVSEEMSIAAVGDDSMKGWWDQFISVPMDEELWHAGECYLGSMGGNDGVVVTFPSATNVVD